MKDLMGHLTQTIPVRLTVEKPDHFGRLKTIWEKRRGSIMPPSPMADMYELTWRYEPYHNTKEGTTYQGRVMYDVTVKWAKHIPVLVKHLHPNQIYHRSRLVALAAEPLMTLEMQQRIDQVQKHKSSYDNIRLSSSVSDTISRIVLQVTAKHMHLDFNHISKYIKEHEDSSLGGGGFKWRDAYTLTRNDWKHIFDMVKANIELLELHPTWYVSNPPQSGMRARSESLPDGFIADRVKLFNTFDKIEVTRTRVITFGNFMSMYTVFISNKKRWYEEVLDEVVKVVHAKGEYYFPYVEGGHIYRLVSDFLVEGRPFHAYDGKKWDASAGEILGEAFHCLTIALGGGTQVGSGQSHTSMLDTIAMIVTSKDLTGKMIVLGDDLNIFSNDVPHTPVVEEDPADTKARNVLGLRYDIDPLVPRTGGLRISGDKAGSMLPIAMDDFVTYHKVVGGKASAETRAAQAGLLFGQFGTAGSLLEHLERIPPSDIKSPRDMLEHIVDSNVEDPFRWAEELGVKDAIVA